MRAFNHLFANYRADFAFYTGLTAYFVCSCFLTILCESYILFKGLRDIGQLKPGETLVVSGAAGSVGSLACQLGKQAGAKVIAIAGSQDKCEWLEKELGVDKAINYKSPKFYEDFKQVGYLDVFFDNVGGKYVDDQGILCTG